MRTVLPLLLPLHPSAASFQPQQVTVASNSEQITLEPPEVLVTSGSGSVDDQENLKDVREGVAEET